MSTPTSAKSNRLPLVIAAIAVIGGGWWWHQHSKSAKDAAANAKGGAPMAVGVTAARTLDAPLQLNALGTVNSTYTVTVRSRVDGQLDKVHFEEGQLVKQGQLLAELDPRPYLAALTQAQGQLLRDQALLQNAQLDLARYRQLLGQNSISKQQVDTQDALVKQYQGTVKLDQGSVDNAKLQLDYSRVTAPVAGRVGLRQVDPGNIVHASDANGVVVITQTQPINVVFAIPEVSLSQVLQAAADNKQLKVEAWDRDNKHKLADGVLLAMDNQLNTSTGTINIKAKFANEKQALFPNQFVNVNLQLGVRKNAIVVPTAAVQLGKAGSYVYTVGSDSTVSISKVAVGPASGDVTIIESGLRAGQQVVIDGVDKLRNGAKVKVIDRAAQSQEAAAAASEGKPHRKHGASGDWGKRHASAAN
ncbi:MdtA/MuxA family multidrug efflux RND transporter periplasmic adaptor subunit [Chromobacterium subtsugae]|uniref:MdtA/MuxA family multidrug efflux RND transporter periplasmic adaptor subunit n=1 Tax=Chromobacterium subtsugae TaxID=251747 RepID=A0ABS7FHB5_9NEIS|nr:MULTISPECIES: MdtA/MuxA family multidrug efflux RND transporter periplasmic adaptor subunit [Chromobacterium]KUM03558.1 multidrug transporter [Chromobacterium subtsugae]KZE88313.1 efflux transporter periplasmic adaptor subunit [Chromobacterium sp. F49]MBW7568692.1 MdtA/MuxA family multidrug efflux RND transporter periplasmic adaptor subunit [Chromobacterium subtsugae]MBW8289478.1 MdtA/MuxA family multidrug efflux RND transporter periplasmic adaptor subunit [Chromobacterium subtsugae]OBU8590